MATIAFFPEGAYGPTNNCVGIGDVLRRRGHRVVFIVEESFAGTLEAQGLRGTAHAAHAAADSRKRFPASSGRTSSATPRRSSGCRRSSSSRSSSRRRSRRSSTARSYVDDRLHEIIDELEPDVIVEDNVVGVRGAAGVRPAMGADRVVQPDRAPRPRRPAACSPAIPRPTARSGRRTGHAYRDAHAELHADFDAFCRERGAPPLPELEFMFESPWLNLYLYPDELDYPRAQPLRRTWHNLQASVRATDARVRAAGRVARRRRAARSTSVSARSGRPTSS